MDDRGVTAKSAVTYEFASWHYAQCSPDRCHLAGLLRLGLGEHLESQSHVIQCAGRCIGIIADPYMCRPLICCKSFIEQ